MLTLYFLQASRAIRSAWLLEELNVPYELKYADRLPDGSAPRELGVPTAVKMSPAIQDGDVIIGESGAIAELVTALSHFLPSNSKLTSSNAGISVNNTISNIGFYPPT